MFALVIPMMMYIGINLSQMMGGIGLAEIWVYVLITAFVEIYLYRKIWKVLLELRPKSLGLEGEMFVGEELNQLMLKGCRVYHDVPIEYGNVDHVVVSPSGVFAVNTKMLGKPRDRGQDEKVTVNYTENLMHFPDRIISIPQQKLLTEAKALSTFLSKSVGEPVTVEAMLALPGWFIKSDRNGGAPVRVFNPKNSAPLFVKNQSKLSEQMVQRIAYQIDQKCRDIEPQLARTRRWELRN
ncbi:MAG TPA: nuclease-related domain-containing protein [Planctomicrobium sp.]|nr:nuclease-related domain-containing protein [Planctomicrobium sp.]